MKTSTCLFFDFCVTCNNEDWSNEGCLSNLSEIYFLKLYFFPEDIDIQVKIINTSHVYESGLLDTGVVS